MSAGLTIFGVVVVAEAGDLTPSAGDSGLELVRGGCAAGKAPKSGLS